MISLSLKTIAQEIDGELVGDGSITVSGVETDSRKNVEGILFVALKGERFDAHEFIKDVEGRKAAAVVTEHRCDVSIPQIIVKDTLKALGKIGLLNRKSCRAKVVSVTGTCGKTSVKEMTSSILKQVGNTVATRGNFNNNIGVPISLLQINENTDFAVIELGANHPHEIEYIVNLAKPDAVAINNVGNAHLEGFGSLDGVYRAKSEILDYAAVNGVPGVVNGDNVYFEKWQSDYKSKVDLHSFSVEGNQQSDFTASNIKSNGDGTFSFILHSPAGQTEVSLKLPGKHNVSNALCASALSYLAGADLLSIRKGLEEVQPSKGRLFVEKFGKIVLIDDAYNASVNAVKASIDTLSTFNNGLRVFVFGDMGELGAEAEELHRSIGVYAKDKIDVFICMGSLSAKACEAFGDNGLHFDTHEDIENYIKELMGQQKEYVIAVKGAHFMRMDKIVEYIRDYCKESKC